MENQDFNQELLDYLYGELNSQERLAFEKKMANDPNLKSEYEELKEVKESLTQLSDADVTAPFSIPSKQGMPTGKRVILFRPVTAVAATLLVLMFIGYLTDFTVSLDNRGLYLGFGTQTAETEKNLGEAEIKALLTDAIRQNNEQIFGRIGSADSTFQVKFTALEESVASEIKRNKSEQIDDNDLRNFLTELENRNSELVKGYLKLSSAQQQEYFKTMLTQFNEFVQEQRSEDLTMIQSNLIELKQVQSIQKKETDQVLAGLITTINYKNKN